MDSVLQDVNMARRVSSLQDSGKIGPRDKKNSAFKKKVLKVIKEESELKYFGTQQVQLPVTTAGYIVDITAIAQGVGDQQRVGDECTLDSLELRYSAAYNLSSALDTFRIIVVEWFPSSTPGIGSILQVTGSTLTPLSYYNKDQEPNFKIHYDSLIDLVGNLSNPKAMHSQQIFLTSMRGARLQFVSGGTTGTSHLYVIAVSDQATTGDYLEYIARVNFLDA